MRLVVVIFFLLINLFTFSQDHIYTTGHDTIEAKILEVAKHNVSFKDLNDKSGDVLSLKKHQIWKIHYADGSEEVYNDHSIWSETFHAVTDAVVDISRVTWAAMLSAEQFMEDKIGDMKDTFDENRREQEAEEERARIAEIADEAEKKKAEEEFKKKQEEEAKQRAEAEAKAKAEEEAKKKAEAEAKKKEEEERQKALEEERKKALLAKDLSVDEQIQKQKEHEEKEDQTEQVVKEEEIPLPKKLEKRKDYEHHSDEHVETADGHSAHASPNVTSQFHSEGKKFVHHNHSKKDGLGPLITGFKGRTDTYTVPLKDAKNVRPSQQKIIDEFFYTDSEIDKYLTKEIVTNYHKYYANYEDYGLDTLTDNELMHLADWSRWYLKKRKNFDEYKKKNPGNAGNVYIPNLTYLDLSYSYTHYRTRKKYKSDGSVYYYIDYKVWVYVRNTSNTTYTYDERMPIARMNFANNKVTGEWFRMRPRKVGEKWAIKPGETLSKMHIVSVKSNYSGASASGPAMKQWDIVFAGPKFDKRGLSDDRAKTIKYKTLRSGIIEASKKSYDELSHEMPWAREYKWRNYKAKAAASEDGKSSIYLYYSFNKFNNEYKDVGNKPVDDAPMHMEVYLNGTYVGPIRKGEVVRIKVPEGDYNVLVQKRKGKLKKEQYSAKNISVKSGTSQFLRVRRISDPRSRPQLYNLPPSMAKGEIEDTHRTFLKWNVTGLEYE